jgi:hypothetical protein
VKTTASTLETFTTLLELAADAHAERFVLTTVDAVSAPGELARFAREVATTEAPLVLGVAPVEANDESPLRVALDAAGRARLGEGPYATIGFYGGRVDSVLPEARAALAKCTPSLRAFLTARASLSDVRGMLVGRTFDVDTPQDVAMAEEALLSWRGGPGGRVR